MTKRLLAGLLFCLSLVISVLPSQAQPFRDAVDDPRLLELAPLLEERDQLLIRPGARSARERDHQPSSHERGHDSPASA